jgi:pyridoxal phosphate enzyme (YggS family)
MSIAERLHELLRVVDRYPGARLVAVSKTHPAQAITEAYAAGQRLFGENRVKDLAEKAASLAALPALEWHMIGHLQRNKVKEVATVAALVHAVDSTRLLDALDAAAPAGGLAILLQVHIAREEAKFGFDEAELGALLAAPWRWPRLRLRGLMGMASNTDDHAQVRREFAGLHRLYQALPAEHRHELSMGMSGDYPIALDCGSTLVRIGTAIFGARPPPPLRPS